MTSVGSIDGRVLRGRRNRDAVVSSFLALIQEGNPRPTARAIAARAGVSLRSVFQHFEEMEQILAEAGRLQVRRLSTFLEPLDRRPGFDQRLDDFVATRRALLEAIDPVARAARLREPFSPQLRKNRDWFVAAGRQQCEDLFAAEIGARRGRSRRQLLDAVAAASSWSTWYCLTEELGLDGDDAAAAMRLTLASLLRPPRRRRRSAA